MYILVYIVVLLFSIMIHEIAHGYVAYLRGDDTAKRAGRLTLNPIPHIDLFGSIILPATLLLLKAPILFGWAKPVPVNYYKLKNPKVDIPLVSVAGPLSNIALAAISGLGIRLIRMFPDFHQGLGASIEAFLFVMLVMNIVLPLINLIPVPPLDGSKVITYFMPARMAEKYLSMNPWVGFIIIYLLLLSGLVWRVLYPILNFLIVVIAGVPLAAL